MDTYQSRLAGTSDVRVQCSTARWRHVTIGFIGYLIPIVVGVFGTTALVESMGVDVPPRTATVTVVVLLAIVVWRGATVSAAVRPDGLRVRNRWRQLVVPWHEIESAEVGSSITYALFDLVDSVRELVDGTDSGLSAEEEMQVSDVLLVTRRGRRRRLPVYATLGLTRNPDEMLAFLDAVEAHGVAVTRERPSPTELPPPSVGTP